MNDNSLPVAPSMSPTLALESVRAPRARAAVNGRVWAISGIAVLVALCAGVVAQVLTRLIALITNIAFYGTLSLATTSPAHNRLGVWVIAVPIAGGVIVGLMARFGSAAIRGHGIPEAMERVLFGQSKIPVRVTFLKPLSAALSIGTGGPFGAEGPIIATGGALGSLFGQAFRISAEERKTLLAAGAAAGMSATFGSPVSAVLLAIELLLFEYRVRSLVPVALASAIACGTRVAASSAAPAFAMPMVSAPSGLALASYIAMGALVGLASTFVTRAVYAIEDGFAKLPIHWMWWPAMGAVVVGVVGFLAPRTLGVGYDNIEQILSGDLAGRAMLLLCGAKLVSWLFSLGSGTSGGTLAPLLTIGGGLGAALETTRQPMGLLPLLGGCTAAYLISSMLMKNTIMTEKIARRGARVVQEYSVDFLEQVIVRDACARELVTIAADDTLGELRVWLRSRKPGTTHQGFPVVAEDGSLLGVVTRRDLFDPAASDDTRARHLLKRGPVVVFESSTLREAADHMVHEGVGRLVVVAESAPPKPVGIITRSDLLAAHKRRLEGELASEPRFDLRRALLRAGRSR